MGASDFDERNNRLDISRYAPPRYRTPAGAAAVPPARERLSRGASAHASHAAAQSVPPDEPLRFRQAQTGSRWSTIQLSMSGRLAAAVGLAAVLAIGSVGFLKSRAGHPVAATQVDSRDTVEPARRLDLPRPVHTVTVRRETMMEGDTQASDVGQAAPLSAQPAASLAERVGAIGLLPAQPRVEPTLALTAPLKLWAMFPGGTSAGEDDTATGTAKTGEQDANDITPTQTAAGQQNPETTKQARRRRQARPRRTQSAAGKPRPAQQAPADAQAKAVQPVRKLPLQAAIDRLFGNNGSSGESESGGSAAPAPPQAAFR